MDLVRVDRYLPRDGMGGGVISVGNLVDDVGIHTHALVQRGEGIVNAGSQTIIAVPAKGQPGLVVKIYFLFAAVFLKVVVLNYCVVSNRID